MNEALALLAYLLVVLIGWSVTRLPAIRHSGLDGRLAFAMAAGTLAVGVLMAGMSLLHVRWSSTRLFVVLGLIALAGLWLTRVRATKYKDHVRVWPVTGIALTLLLITCASLSAHMTTGDLMFFWAPKGIRFFRSGGIDVAFLRAPDYFLMHSDYPPLMPLLFSWSNIVSRQFGWYAAVLTTVLFLAGIVGLVRATARDDYGGLLVAAVMAYSFLLNFVGGGADPLLLLYETVTLCALTFLPAGRSQAVLAAIGMAGAVWTKVEGAAFVVAVVVAFALVRPKHLARVIAMVLPAVVLLGGWLLFVRRQNLLDTYRGASNGLFLHMLPQTIGQLVTHARMNALWLPWLVPIALIAFGANRRRALIPLFVTALDLAATVYFYIHEPDPKLLAFWIDSSANRTLLPALLALCVAAVAAGPGPGLTQLPSDNERMGNERNSSGMRA